MKLELTTYTPNWNDPRNLRRLEKVLDWCSTYYYSPQPVHVHTYELIKVFGQQQHQLSCYLRANLLINEDSSYIVGVKSKGYRINRKKFTKFLSYLKDGKTLTQIITDKYREELIYDKPFEYHEVENRYYHPLLNVSRKDKDEVFKDWFNYDISCAMPTMMLQLGKEQLETINYFIENKQKVRKDISKILDIPLQDVKKILTALFNGGNLKSHPEHAIFKILNKDKHKLELLRQNNFIQQYVQESKFLWNKIRMGYPIDNLENYQIYFREEGKINLLFQKFCDQQNIHCFREHDGFRTKNSAIISADLERLIFLQTGYNVFIE